MPITVVSARCSPNRLRSDAAAMYGAISQNDTATPRWARRSAVSDTVREPVNRHTTMTLARPSTALPSAQPVSAIEPTNNRCHSPTAPSISTQARLTPASHRAHLAARCHPASRTTGCGKLRFAPPASRETSAPSPADPATVRTSPRSRSYRFRTWDTTPRRCLSPPAPSPHSQADRPKPAGLAEIATPGLPGQTSPGHTHADTPDVWTPSTAPTPPPPPSRSPAPTRPPTAARSPAGWDHRVNGIVLPPGPTQPAALPETPPEFPFSDGIATRR